MPIERYTVLSIWRRCFSFHFIIHTLFAFNFHIFRRNSSNFEAILHFFGAAFINILFAVMKFHAQQVTIKNENGELNLGRLAHQWSPQLPERNSLLLGVHVEGGSSGHAEVTAERKAGATFVLISLEIDVIYWEHIDLFIESCIICSFQFAIKNNLFIWHFNLSIVQMMI